MRPKSKDIDIDKAKDLAYEGLYIDGSHHKQWFLEEILKALGCDIDEIYRRVKEDDEEWTRGVAP